MYRANDPVIGDVDERRERNLRMRGGDAECGAAQILQRDIRVSGIHDEAIVQTVGKRDAAGLRESDGDGVGVDQVVRAGLGRCIEADERAKVAEATPSLRD